MAEHIVDIKIETAITEMEFYLGRLSPFDAKLEQYTVPNISVTDLTETGDGRTLAQVEADIRKDRAKYRQGAEYRYYRNLEEYWTIGAKYHLRKPSLSLAAKSVILLQMRENILRNFADLDPEPAARLADVASDLLAVLEEARSESGEVDLFPVRLDTLRRRAPQLESVHSLKIVKFHKGIFLDARNFRKLEDHARRGAFDRGECCTFRLTRQILYE